MTRALLLSTAAVGLGMVAIALLFVAGGGPFGSELPRFEETSCTIFPEDPASTECGWLVVAEDRDDPSAGELRLMVVRVRATDPDPHPDPIVYLSGGPGFATIPDLDHVQRALRTPERDLIVFDQRGTGRSQPSLACPEYVEAVIDAVDEGTSAALELRESGIEACAQRLLAENTAFHAYSSRENAADVADLRRALGYEQVNLVGLSYGSRLTLAVLRDHPDAVRSAVLDSAVPLAVDLAAELAPNAERAFDLLFTACATERACATAHPDLSARFWALVDRLTLEPMDVQTFDPEIGSLSWRIDGDALIDLVFSQLYDASAIPRLPGFIADLEAGRDTALLPPLRRQLHQLRFMSHGMNLLVMCNDGHALVDRSVKNGLADSRLEQWAAHALQPGLDFCDRHRLTDASAPAGRAVASETPTLLLAGGFDPITPPAWAELAAETLSESQLFVFPSVGHAVFFSDACGAEVVRVFITAPSEAVTAPCLSSLRADPFRP